MGIIPLSAFYRVSVKTLATLFMLFFSGFYEDRIKVPFPDTFILLLNFIPRCHLDHNLLQTVSKMEIHNLHFTT